MTKFDELKERFPNLIPVQELRSTISIIELATYNGYQPLNHKGRSRLVLQNQTYHDTIIIKNPLDASQQIYQQAGDFTDAGTIIDFIRHRLTTVFARFNQPGQHELKTITSVLYDYLRIDANQTTQQRHCTNNVANPGVKPPFNIEQLDIRPLEKGNYLHQRHITKQTLERPEFADKVLTQITYVDLASGHAVAYLTAKQHPQHQYRQFTNVAFPYYDGHSTQITGLELRNQTIKLHAPGSDRTNSVFVSNPPPKTTHFFVTESAIDALSHRQLRSLAGDDQFDSVYFSTGGQLTPQQVDTMARYIHALAKTDNWQLHLCFDNDVKGHQYDLQFIQQLTAAKFPLSPTKAPTGWIAYILPQQEAYRPIREALLKRVEAYNETMLTHLTNSATAIVGQHAISARLLVIQGADLQFQLHIPQACPPLTAVTKSLLEVTGLGQRLQLNKADSKDFNQDLGRAM